MTDPRAIAIALHGACTGLGRDEIERLWENEFLGQAYIDYWMRLACAALAEMERQKKEPG